MILITGATGLVGCHLLLELLQNDVQVRALHRKGSDMERVKRVLTYYTHDAESLFDKIQWYQADLLDLAELDAAFQGVTEVYHCAALISFDPADKDRLYDTNVIGTTNIVNLCIQYGIRKICHVSSIAALGDALEHEIITEEVDWDEQTVANYAITKYRAEMEVWRGVQEGVPAVIVNPGIIIGPGFWHTGSGTLFKMVAKGQRWYPPGGTGIVSINDVIRSMTALMDSHIQNERFILVNKNMTYKEIFSMIAREFDMPPPDRALKLWQLKVMLPLDWLRAKLRGKSRRLTSDNIRGVSRRKVYDGQKIVNTLPFTYELISEAVYASCQIYKKEFPEKFNS